MSDRVTLKVSIDREKLEDLVEDSLKLKEAVNINGTKILDNLDIPWFEIDWKVKELLYE